MYFLFFTVLLRSCQLAYSGLGFICLDEYFNVCPHGVAPIISIAIIFLQ